MKNQNLLNIKNQIESRLLENLIPYGSNSRTHSDAQINQIAASIQEFGWTNPILIDKKNRIICGHGRLLAAKKLDMATVPVIVLDHLSEAQRRAYIIADNQLAINAGWDIDLLQFELSALKDLDFDLSVIGFSGDELERLLKGLDFEEGTFDDNESDPTFETYSQKVEIPVYEPEGEKPEVRELFDRTKTDDLCKAIYEANLPEDIQDFLLFAAARHTVFDFERIANYYAHSDKKIQRLMEDSALVIIDFKKAIENGFVRLNEQVEAAFKEDYPNA